MLCTRRRCAHAPTSADRREPRTTHDALREAVAMRCYTGFGIHAASRVPMLSILPSALAILICGLAGAVGAWLIANAFGWNGPLGAGATAIIGMVFATALWIARASL